MRKNKLPILALLLSLSLCASGKVSVWQSAPPIDVNIGDVVVRKGHGTWTPYFINCSSREKRFSHVGIVVSNETECVIVHSDANEWSGVGRVRLQPWQDFYAESLECAIFRYSGSPDDARRFAENGMVRLGVPFDRSFDMSETNRLYCTEFVREVVNDSVKTNLIGWTIVCDQRVIALDDIYKEGFDRIYDSHHPELCTETSLK